MKSLRENDRLVRRLREKAPSWPPIDSASTKGESGPLVHDWRTYIPYEIVDMWSQLTERERLLLAITAQKVADTEEWS